jgi:hypothetical protein
LELSVKSGHGLTNEGKIKKMRNSVSLNDKLVLTEWKEKKFLSYKYHLTA